ncbi:hypothetical protein GLAREA_07757 [Glarea lozoyensis ATCC 20868]|uniref:Ankyrin repeat-containing protein n=1 Tax=Glarea lozoyensis (strain ATCC 20868 / MF5171) TaxID=1116229 RepID=S3E2C8_GLAL2|nr:uncharacterized protein GLAREA_07757 [Glarea lozoyensis ATCC 20868]EPE32623.1 hypothetical protein GLAREA_07757 [Glarea lozoyensis ATCC 20868]
MSSSPSGRRSSHYGDAYSAGNLNSFFSAHAGRKVLGLTLVIGLAFYAFSPSGHISNQDVSHFDSSMSEPANLPIMGMHKNSHKELHRSMYKRTTDEEQDKDGKDSDTTTDKKSDSTDPTSAGGASGKWKPLTAAQKKHVVAIKSSESTDDAAIKAMEALGFDTPLDPPSPVDLTRGGIRLAIPVTIIDLAAMSLKPKRLEYALKKDKDGAEKSNPLGVLAGNTYLADQKETLAQMKLLLADERFDANKEEFPDDSDMKMRLDKLLGRNGRNKKYTPATPLEKACDALFVDAVKLLIEKGAKVTPRAKKVLAKYDDEEEEEDQVKVKAIKALLT